MFYAASFHIQYQLPSIQKLQKMFIALEVCPELKQRVGFQIFNFVLFVQLQSVQFHYCKKKKSCALIQKTFSSRKGDDNLLREKCSSSPFSRGESYSTSSCLAVEELLLHFFDKLISNTALRFISLFW